MQTSLHLKSKKLPDLKEVSQQMIDFAEGVKVWTLEGDLGAGKTTFVQHVCALLGTDDLVNSPTFSIVNEYLLHDGNPCYHFDFYRVKNMEEALDIGFEEYLYSGHWCFIEWPEVVESLLPDDYLRIEIGSGQNEERNFNVTRHG